MHGLAGVDSTRAYSDAHLYNGPFAAAAVQEQAVLLARQHKRHQLPAKPQMPCDLCLQAYVLVIHADVSHTCEPPSWMSPQTCDLDTHAMLPGRLVS